ncbi:ATP-binding protein [Actinoplanes sp. NPDC049265]|uniref:ATP-binding protein n=1 Tax=Actinoplanes sp. NPDC049265 TaxID=3363902 RepID=UPI00371C536F
MDVNRDAPRRGRREGILDAALPAYRFGFATRLRDLRRECGQPPYRALSRFAHCCSGSLSEAASGRRFPTWETTRGYVTGCLRHAGREADIDRLLPQWRRMWEDADVRERGRRTGPPPTGQAGRESHRQPLSAATALSASSGLGPDAPVPQQLPAGISDFTGRTAELDRLTALPPVTDDGPPTAVVIAMISGTAGVGKTAFAVHAAQLVADRYPDGQLFIDLRGHTPGMAPREPGEALDHLLRVLGFPGTQIPTSLEERAALYRTRLADQRTLIVLDNAAAESQVTPLLPGGPGCLVLITSRCRLAGLDRTHTLSLDTLSRPDAVTLLLHASGAERLVGQPPDLLVELVELCGRLPLAIRVAAARLRSHPAWGLSHLVARLGDQRQRLTELEAGERSVTAALDLSYEHLSPEQQHAYRLLGVHPGPDFDEYAAGALLDSTVDRAGRVLGQLLDVHLLQEPRPGRYRFHDLVRAHAAQTAARDQAQPARRAALNRMLDYYRHTAALAVDTAYPYERERHYEVSLTSIRGPDLHDPAAALGWLDDELTNLLAAARHTAEHSRSEDVLYLATILHWHLRCRGRYQDAETLHHQALTTARATSRRAGELEALTRLGHLHRLQGRYTQAAEHLEQALRIAQATGHCIGELDALIGLGRLHWMQGRYAQAADSFEQALRMARAAGHRIGELDALIGLGRLHWAQGRYAQAADSFEQALRMARATSHSVSQLAALNGLGLIHRRQGRYAQAAEYHREALRIARAVGYRVGELSALTSLGHVGRLQGRYEQATHGYQQALELARATGDRNYEFEALHGLGRLRQAVGDPDAAVAHLDQALALAGVNELDQPVDEARAHDGLGHAHYALDQREQARKHWQHALHILTRTGVEGTDDEEATVATIQAHLTYLDRGRPPDDQAGVSEPQHDAGAGRRRGDQHDSGSHSRPADPARR